MTADAHHDPFLAASSGPLSGLVVADFSRILAGPYATMLLADLGATVVKVEGPRGDDTRTWMPPVRDGESTYYLGVNRNKRSIALNLKDEDDLATARALAARADILLENMKPGGMARFGLGYEDVAAANPGIVYGSITGFGTGGGAGLPGYDLMVQGMSGLMSLTGPADGPPHRAGISVFDVMTGMHALIGILAALHHRSLTGRGQHVEVNLLSSAMSGLVNQTSAAVAGGVTPTSMGNAHPSLFPYEPLATADGQIIVIAGNDGQFALLCDLLGVPDLVDDERFASNDLRTEHRDELQPLLEDALAARTTNEWFGTFREAGLPGGPVWTVPEGVAFATELGLEPVVEVGEGERIIPTVRNPIGLSETPPDHHLAPPRLDEHGAEVRAWLAAGAEDGDAA
ncbi:MAG TPA: CoA transferase [Nitriliruptoraceae bacterium]|nr:CoA transferase [Nitriliruptoraceae bacterium]